MSTETEVKRAAFTKADEVLDGEEVMWPNVSFTPPDRTKWFAVHYIPVSNAVSTLGDEGENRVEAFLQIDVNLPLNSGEKAMDDQLKVLEDSFTPGTSAVYDSQTVVFTGCRRSPGRDVNGFWRVSLTIDLYSKTTRATLNPE